MSLAPRSACEVIVSSSLDNLVVLVVKDVLCVVSVKTAEYVLNVGDVWKRRV